MAIAAESLRPDQYIFVKGRVAFNRISRQYVGQELQQRIQQQRAAGSYYPVEVPHTNMSITDAEVLYADPNSPTTEEQFVGEKTYISKKGENAGKPGFSIDDKSNSLPPVLVKNDNGNYEQVKISADLDTGLEVILVIRTFAPKNYAKKGLALHQVLVEEPIRYYQSGASNAELANRGIVIEGNVEPVPAAEANAAANAPVPADTGTDGLPTPGTQAAPAQAPTAEPVAPPAQAQAPAQQAPAPQAAPASGPSAFDDDPAPAPAPSQGQPAGQESPWD